MFEIIIFLSKSYTIIEDIERYKSVCHSLANYVPSTTLIYSFNYFISDNINYELVINYPSNLHLLLCRRMEKFNLRLIECKKHNHTLVK